ncbi:MAG TPA: thioredoxin domain-containing protein [Clostridia bacterium]|nr:thioredoxin domain-containing protein [Clostridia bacterium]
MRNRLVAVTVLLFVLCGAMLAADTSSLRPPKGARVAIIVFEDMQCPDCGRAEPLLKEASQRYKIPLIRYDFPLPMHNWAFEAHVIARYFDTKSPQLGEEFRHWVLMNQRSINKQNLRGMADRFAEEHKTPLPAFLDTNGELANKVRADFQLGQKVGIDHTPTIYVVSNTQRGTPFVEVVDRSQLFQLVEEMLKNSEPVASEKPAAKPAAKKSGAKKPAAKKPAAQ